MNREQMRKINMILQYHVMTNSVDEVSLDSVVLDDSEKEYFLKTIHNGFYFQKKGTHLTAHSLRVGGASFTPKGIRLDIKKPLILSQRYYRGRMMLSAPAVLSMDMLEMKSRYPFFPSVEYNPIQYLHTIPQNFLYLQKQSGRKDQFLMEYSFEAFVELLKIANANPEENWCIFCGQILNGEFFPNPFIGNSAGIYVATMTPHRLKWLKKVKANLPWKIDRKTYFWQFDAFPDKSRDVKRILDWLQNLIDANFSALEDAASQPSELVQLYLDDKRRQCIYDMYMAWKNGDKRVTDDMEILLNLHGLPLTRQVFLEIQKYNIQERLFLPIFATGPLSFSCNT